MKKILTHFAKLFSLVFICVIPLSVSSCSSDEFSSEGLQYELSDDGTYYEVRKFNFYEEEVEKLLIPATYDGLPVKSIAKSALHGCSNVEEVIISEGIVTIEEEAFRDCVALTSITIPDSVTTIEMNCFYGCVRLENISIGNGITNIEGKVVSRMEDINQIKYNNYENGLYLGNENNPYVVLVSVQDITCETFTIHNSTKIISGTAFSDCEELKEIELPSSITCLAHRAFADCTSLKRIDIPANVSTIAESAFTGCTSLSYIYVNNGNINYSSKDGILYNKDQSEKIIIPERWKE